MVAPSLIDLVQQRMQQLEITQAELATACGLSQPHLSKVLANRVKLARKTESKLTGLLHASGVLSEGSPNDFVRSLATRMGQLRPTRRMQIMELLRAIERVIAT